MQPSQGQRGMIEEVRIQRVDISALDTIHDLLDRATKWLAARGMNHWNGVHTKERIEVDFEKSHVLLARLGNEAVGTVTISFATPWYHQPNDSLFWQEPGAFAGFIRKLVVAPEHMKQGIATKLLLEAEKDARSHGALFARLDTNPAFPALVPYYSNRGYTKRGERDGNSFFEKVLLPSS